MGVGASGRAGAGARCSDALTRTKNQLTAEQAAQLLDDEEALASQASRSSIAAFEKHLRRRARALETEQDAETRLEHQRRATTLKHWIDRDDGMWCFSGRFDPLTGRDLARTLDATTNTLLAEKTPETAPSNPIEKQQHLNALALLRLVDGDAPAGKAPGEPIVVVDATTAIVTDPAGPDTASRPELDWGLPIEVPMSVLVDIFDAAEPDLVVVANGVVLHAPGKTNLGRTARLASHQQRRALRGLYSTCAIPGCSTHFDRLKMHHVIWWEHGGRTDLDNLLPVCAVHHSKIHHDGWLVSLGPNRELRVERPDGRVMTTGPPHRHAA